MPDITIPIGPWALEEAWGREAEARIKAMSSEEIVAGQQLYMEKMARYYDDDEQEDAEYRQQRIDRKRGYSISEGVALFQLHGPMTKSDSCMSWFYGGMSTVRLRQSLRNAARDPAVRSILIDVDSPGGQVSGTSELAADIAKIRKMKPVVAYVSDMAASAAYWVASQCDAVLTSSTAMIGSIGAYMVVEDTSRMYENRGIKVEVIKSANFKGSGTDGTTITEPQKAEWRRNIKAIHSQFVKAVATGRSMSEKQADDVADGRCHVGQAAVDLGLADAVCDIDGALGYTRACIPGQGFNASHPAISNIIGADNETGGINDVVPPLGGSDTLPVPSGKEDSQMASLKEQFLSLIGRLPDTVDPVDASEDVNKPAPVVPAPVADTSKVVALETQVSALTELIKSQNAAIEELRKSNAEASAQAQLASLKSEVKQLTKDMKITPAQAADYNALAETDPKSLTAILPILQKQPPLVALAGKPTIDSKSLVPDGDGAATIVARAKELKKQNPKLTADECFKMAQAENPQAAQEARAAMDEATPSLAYAPVAE